MAHLMDIPSLPSLSATVSMPDTITPLPMPAVVPPAASPSQAPEGIAPAVSTAPTATGALQDTAAPAPPPTTSSPPRPTRAAMQDELNQHSQQMNAMKESLQALQAQQENMLRTFNTTLNDMETRLQEKMQSALAPMAAVQEQSAGLQATVTKLQSAARARKIGKILLFLVLLAGAVYFIVTSRKAKQGAATTSTVQGNHAFHRMVVPPRSEQAEGERREPTSRRVRPGAAKEPVKHPRGPRRESRAPPSKPARRPPSPRPASVQGSPATASPAAQEGGLEEYE